MHWIDWVYMHTGKAVDRLNVLVSFCCFAKTYYKVWLRDPVSSCIYILIVTAPWPSWIFYPWEPLFSGFFTCSLSACRLVFMSVLLKIFRRIYPCVILWELLTCVCACMQGCMHVCMPVSMSVRLSFCLPAAYLSAGLSECLSSLESENLLVYVYACRYLCLFAYFLVY